MVYSRFSVRRYDRVTDTRLDVSHASGRPATAVAGNSPRLSDDGSVVLFQSPAPDIAAGVVDQNNASDVFLWRAATGESTLVSHRAGDALKTGEAGASALWLKHDASHVYYASLAKDHPLAVATGVREYDLLGVALPSGMHQRVTPSGSDWQLPRFARSGARVAYY